MNVFLRSNCRPALPLVFTSHRTTKLSVRQMSSSKVVRLSDEILTSSRLSSGELRSTIDVENVKSVIYLQTRGESSFCDDSKLMEELNVRYCHYPILPSDWTKVHVDNIVKEIQNSPATKLVMCGSNVRAMAAACISEVFAGRYIIDLHPVRMTQDDAVKTATAVNSSAGQLVKSYMSQ